MAEDHGAALTMTELAAQCGATNAFAGSPKIGFNPAAWERFTHALRSVPRTLHAPTAQQVQAHISEALGEDVFGPVETRAPVVVAAAQDPRVFGEPHLRYLVRESGGQVKGGLISPLSAHFSDWSSLTSFAKSCATDAIKHGWLPNPIPQAGRDRRSPR